MAVTQDARIPDSLKKNTGGLGAKTSDAPPAVLLRRTVRFCVNFSGDKDLRQSEAAPDLRANTFAGAPGMAGLGAYYEIAVACRGAPDRVTGYLVNISAIDRAVRTVAIPMIERAFEARPQPPTTNLLRDMRDRIARELDVAVHEVLWQLTPYHAIVINVHAPDRVSIRQSFEFAAAHRLHVDALGEDANRAIFGKCNNPSGHGHNYRLEVAASAPLNEQPPRFTLRVMEDIVMRHIVDHFDHKHLNRDTPEFADLNPSVENIARACHQRLAEPIAQAGGSLERVTVWETEKTSCTFPA